MPPEISPLESGTKPSAPSASFFPRLLRKLHAEPDVRPASESRCIRLHDKTCDGVRVRDLSKTCGLSITISQVRPRKQREAIPASPDMRLRQGDTILVIGRRADLDVFCEQAGGKPAPLDYLRFADTQSLSAGLGKLK